MSTAAPRRLSRALSRAAAVPLALAAILFLAWLAVGGAMPIHWAILLAFVGLILLVVALVAALLERRRR